MKNIIYLWFPPKDHGIGGMYAHVKGIISGYLDNGYFVTLITSSKNIPLKHPNLKVELVENNSKLIYPLNMISYTKKITPFVVSKIKELNPEFIYHRYELFVPIFQRLGKYDINSKLILEYNGSYVWTIKHWTGSLIKKMFGTLLLPKIKSFEKKQLKTATNIIVVSDPLKKHLIDDYNVLESKVLVVTNGYDPDVFYPIPKREDLVKSYGLLNKKIIGFTGTFYPWHGTDIFAKSIKSVIEKRKDVHFLFVGDGLFKEECQKIISADKVSDYVTFTGKIPFIEMNDYLNLCDVLVNPTVENKDGSEFFGSPTKLFEYVGTKKTIITSNIGQMKEIFKEEDVYFINPGDHIDLAKKILLAIDSPKSVKNPGKYTWITIVKNIIDYTK